MPFLFLHTLQFFPSDTEVLFSSGRQCLLVILGRRAILGLYEVVADCSFRDFSLSAQILPQHKTEIDNLG